jgi:hypothetical protein
MMIAATPPRISERSCCATRGMGSGMSEQLSLTITDDVSPYPTTAELEAGFDVIRQAPKDRGVLQLIVRRPRVEAREVLEEAQLDPVDGLIGDNWRARGSARTADGSAHPDMQLNIMNARAIALVARDRVRWALAGDQLYIDMDLSTDNLPVDTHLAIGTAVIAVTAIPHTGCKKFRARFGMAAMEFVNSPEGRAHRLRGMNARIVRSGVIRVGDVVRKL